MSKLLHSKTFRNNLIKWLMIYACVMLSTVSVITYSKYISSLQTSSSAKSANFILDVEKGDICSATYQDECNLSKYKSNDLIDYNFNVDTTQMEVKTLLVLTINVNSNFDIEKLYVDDSEIDLTNTSGYTLSNNTITISEEVGINNTFERNYKVRISLNNNTNTSISDAIVVNYAATQIN